MMEYEYEYAPAWRFVGRYLHWTERIEQIAASYLRELFNMDESTSIPPVSLFFPSLYATLDTPTDYKPTTYR
jgi:hypothetical protein